MTLYKGEIKLNKGIKKDFGIGYKTNSNYIIIIINKCIC